MMSTVTNNLPFVHSFTSVHVKRMLCSFTLVALGLLIQMPTTRGEAIHIAVASNFHAAMPPLVAAFDQVHHHKIKASYGSSGKLYAQILHGAPFHVFLSADQHKPENLERTGLGVKGTRFTYALGKLVLWSIKPNLIDANASRLRAGHFKKLALANPRLAPYGRAAQEVLKKLGLVNSTSKWVMGENIAQTFQFVRTGNADLGFVALSQLQPLQGPGRGSWWLVPPDLYSPIKQDAVLLVSALDHPGARAWLRFLRSAKARDILHSYGYDTPPDPNTKINTL